MHIALFAVLIAVLCLSACVGVGLMQLGSSGDFVGLSFQPEGFKQTFHSPMFSTTTLFGSGVAILCGSLVLLTLLLVFFRVRR